MSSSGEIQEQSSRTRVGVLRVPECNGPFRVTGSYVYGIFITAPSAMNSTLESVSLEAATELLRQPIRDALSQWTLCAPINLGVITSAGGLVQSDDNRLVVTLPPGAVSSQVNIYFANQVDPNLLLPANMADLGRFGLDALDENGSPFHTFNTPITIDAGYQDEDLASSGGDESRISLARYDERLEQWVLLPSTVNPATNRVSAQVQHFSVFAVLVNQGTYKIYAPAVSR